MAGQRLCGGVWCGALCLAVVVLASALPADVDARAVRPRVRRTTATSGVHPGMRAAALSEATVLGAAFAGAGSIVVAMATADDTSRQGGQCQQQLVAWDTQAASSQARTFVLPAGLCVGALSWSEAQKKVAIGVKFTGHVVLFDPAAWQISGTPTVPVNGNGVQGWPTPEYPSHEIRNCGISSMWVLGTSSDSQADDVLVGWGPTVRQGCLHGTARLHLTRLLLGAWSAVTVRRLSSV